MNGFLIPGGVLTEWFICHLIHLHPDRIQVYVKKDLSHDRFWPIGGMFD